MGGEGKGPPLKKTTELSKDFQQVSTWEEKWQQWWQQKARSFLLLPSESFLQGTQALQGLLGLG